jgi:5-methylcytosine-specific restriction protein B
MARQISKRDLSPILAAAAQWLETCLIEDHSLFQADARWTASLVDDVYRAFVEHPDYGDDDFMTKLKGQMKPGSPSAQQLMAEMLWALLLFPSNMRARTKRLQIRDIWSLSGQQLDENYSLLSDAVLAGIGSGGPGFNNYRPAELEYLISLVRDLKQKNESERRRILTDYDVFFKWIDVVPRNGSRQFRHMLRFFAFPDRVERISSNNDRRKILEAFGTGSRREIREWKDRQLDDKLMELRTKLQSTQPSGAVLDFYDAPLKEKWSSDRKIKTPQGEITVTVPADTDELEDQESAPIEATTEARKSIRMQSKLARIGAVMGFKIWIPRADRARVRDLVPQKDHSAFLEILPLNY